jgi:hypothetical protein
MDVAEGFTCDICDVAFDKLDAGDASIGITMARESMLLCGPCGSTGYLGMMPLSAFAAYQGASAAQELQTEIARMASGERSIPPPGSQLAEHRRLLRMVSGVLGIGRTYSRDNGANRVSVHRSVGAVSPTAYVIHHIAMNRIRTAAGLHSTAQTDRADMEQVPAPGKYVEEEDDADSAGSDAAEDDQQRKLVSAERHWAGELFVQTLGYPGVGAARRALALLVNGVDSSLVRCLAHFTELRELLLVAIRLRRVRRPLDLWHIVERHRVAAGGPHWVKTDNWITLHHYTGPLPADPTVALADCSLTLQAAVLHPGACAYVGPRKLCWNCRTADVATSACARCKVARYCGVQCQRAHWSGSHRGPCNQASEIIEVERDRLEVIAKLTSDVLLGGASMVSNGVRVDERGVTVELATPSVAAGGPRPGYARCDVADVARRLASGRERDEARDRPRDDERTDDAGKKPNRC